ncbi:MAG: recombinase family protein [Patescibacteria group bacterium]
MSKYIKEHNFSKNRYFLYARKSTESEDKQVASIPAQFKVMQSVADELGLKIVDKFSESSSGFHVGRKVFNEMLARIEKGEAEGIIVWKLSRLSRNPDDAGRIMGMLQRAEIEHIRTVDRNWLPEDNVMMMYVEFGVTNQFSRDLSDDTHRGLNDKVDRGWSPKSTLPLGYMHYPFKKMGKEEILPDPCRFGIVQKTLKKVAYGELTPVQAREYANDLGLRTRPNKRNPISKPVSSSTFYRMLLDPFYYGKFEYPKNSGNWYDGKHKKAITEEEYEMIQTYRGRKDAPRPQKHLFPYTGMIKCGECGCSIVIDPKVKVTKSGKRHEYRYYRCTKSKGGCNQRYLEMKKMEKQLGTIIKEIKIPEAFHEWALEELQKDLDKDTTDRKELNEMAQKGYDEAVEQITELVKGYVAKRIPEDAYNATLPDLEKQKKKYKKILDTTDKRIKEWTNKAERAFNFALTAKKRFEKGDLETKNEILRNLGTNIVIKDLNISLEIDAPLIVIKKAKPKFEKAMQTLEPLKWSENKEEMKVLMSQNPIWGG